MASPPPDPTIQSIQPILGDRYQLQQSLGKKAGRQTWLAQDLQTQELVVVKLLTFGNDFAWDDLKLFEREAATLQSLSHPAIPRYRDYFETELPNGKGFALVQGYIAAKSLEEQLKAGRIFSEVEVKQLARELLGILVYLHGNNPPVIHRDIKPSNILLGDRSGNSPGRVYLVDFGSVQTLAAREGGTITIVGTYGYMPPEQFGGRAVPASDLYSLGATLIYLVTGCHPADLPQLDLCIQFESTASLSPTLTSWLKWLVEPSLNKRPATAQEALAELDNDWGAEETIAVPVTTITQPATTSIDVRRNSKFLEVVLPSAQAIVPNLWRWWISLVVVLLLPTGLGVGLAIAITLLSRWQGKTHIRLDQRQLLITRDIFGWQYTRPLFVPQRHLWKLVLLTRKQPARLILCIGTQTCEVQGTSDEMQWLAYELSRWLDLPINTNI